MTEDLRIHINSVSDKDMKTIVKMIEMNGYTIRLECSDDQIDSHIRNCIRGYHVDDHNLKFCGVCGDKIQGSEEAFNHVKMKHDKKDILKYSIMGDDV